MSVIKKEGIIYQSVKSKSHFGGGKTNLLMLSVKLRKEDIRKEDIMKIRHLLVALISIPLFAGQISIAPVDNASHAKPAHPFSERLGDTLKYDTEGFNDGLGLYSSSGQTTPP